MKVRLTKSETVWLMKVTRTQTPQDGIDAFAELMKLEGIDPKEIVTLIKLMMDRGVDC